MHPLPMVDLRSRTPRRGGGPDRRIHSIGAYAPGAGKALRRRLSAAAFMLACWLLPALAGCARTPPEEALRASIAAMEQAAEARDADALGEFLAEDFVGPGGMDRDTFR